MHANDDRSACCPPVVDAIGRGRPALSSLTASEEDLRPPQFATSQLLHHRIESRQPRSCGGGTVLCDVAPDLPKVNQSRSGADESHSRPMLDRISRIAPSYGTTRPAAMSSRPA